MKLCSIVPVKYNELMYESNIVMLLAHLSKNNPAYIANAVRHDNDCYKIMDNSVVELGSSFNMEELIKQAQCCLADEIVLPDVYRDGEKTIQKVIESIKWLRDNKYLGDFKLMAVCHGKNIDDFIKTFKTLNSMSEIDTIGIPRIICEWAGSRSFIADIFIQTDKEIHLLGCYDSLKELSTFKAEHLERIRSIDTSLPALLSLESNNAYKSRNGKTIDLFTGEINYDNYETILTTLKEDFDL